MKKILIQNVACGALLLTACNGGRVIVAERPVVLVWPVPPQSNFVWIGSGYVKREGKYPYRSGQWN